MPHVTIKPGLMFCFRNDSTRSGKKLNIKLEKKRLKVFILVSHFIFQGDMQDCRSVISVVSANKLCYDNKKRRLHTRYTGDLQPWSTALAVCTE